MFARIYFPPLPMLLYQESRWLVPWVVLWGEVEKDALWAEVPCGGKAGQRGPGCEEKAPFPQGRYGPERAHLIT